MKNIIIQDEIINLNLVRKVQRFKSPDRIRFIFSDTDEKDVSTRTEFHYENEADFESTWELIVVFMDAVY